MHHSLNWPSSRLKIPISDVSLETQHVMDMNAFRKLKPVYEVKWPLISVRPSGWRLVLDNALQLRTRALRYSIVTIDLSHFFNHAYVSRLYDSDVVHRE